MVLLIKLVVVFAFKFVSIKVLQLNKNEVMGAIIVKQHSKQKKGHNVCGIMHFSEQIHEIVLRN